MENDNQDHTAQPNTGTTAREKIAMIVLLSSIIGMVILALTVIVLACLGKNSTAAKDVFNSLLPVFGTWVGTLLAFYFTKDNFEAATKSVTNMASRMTLADQKLQQIPVKEKMRPLKSMTIWPLKRGEEAACVLSKLLDGSKYDRVPMLDDQNRLVYLVYLATINHFISQLAMGKATVAGKGPLDVTLQDMFAADPQIKVMAEKSFGFVAQTASLSDAQREIERVSKDCACNDVFVTATGKPDEAILGWVTDNTIAENLKA